MGFCVDNGHIMLIFGFSTLLGLHSSAYDSGRGSQRSQLWHFSHQPLSNWLGSKLQVLFRSCWNREVYAVKVEAELNFNGMHSHPDAGRISRKWVGWPVKYSFKYSKPFFFKRGLRLIPEGFTWDITSPWHIRTWIKRLSQKLFSKIQALRCLIIV